MFDFKIDEVTKDIIIDNKDIAISDELYSHVVISLFTNLNKDIVLDTNVGSELYLYEQSKLTTATITNVKNAIKDSLSQLNLDFTIETSIINNTLNINIVILNVSDENITKISFKL